jgi:hypothetical protein
MSFSALSPMWNPPTGEMLNWLREHSILLYMSHCWPAFLADAQLPGCARQRRADSAVAVAAYDSAAVETEAADFSAVHQAGE